MNGIRNIFFPKGLFLFFTVFECVHQAPLLLPDLQQSGIQYSSSLPSYEVINTLNSSLHKNIHLLKVSPMNINDGLTVDEKLRVVAYLSKLEEREQVDLQIRQTKSIDSLPYVFEEDIILTPKQAEILYESRNPRQKRKLNTDLHRHWLLPIQYAFDGSHNETEKSVIKSALNYWESYTCIKFEEIKYRDNASINANQVYLVFTSNEGCWSFVGRGTSREQKVSIYQDCVYEGHVLHEIGHVIGFWHEHARPDRDRYITVQEDAIQYGKQYNFLHISWKDLDTKSMPYDVGSIMHYGSTAYANEYVNPVPPTILTKNPLLQRALGQRFQLSFYDVKLANYAYCSDKCNSSKLAQPCLHDGYQDPKFCTRCRCPDGLGGDYCETAAPSVGDRCGGELHVTGEAMTIEFAGGYRFGQQCNWYLKASPNSRIFFNVESSQIMEYSHCTTNKYVECLNYLEVRYSHNIAETGARICCSHLEDTKPIISESNEMLVLMRTYVSGSYGFRAKVWAESCGGCASGTELNHKPCSRSVSYECEHTWNYTTWHACANSSWWWADNKDCNKTVNRTAVRKATCQRSDLYCCSGYQLDGDMCIKDGQSTILPIVLEPINGSASTEYSVPTNNPENDPIKGWGNWTEWSNCSQPCGGCGNQTRTRFCYDPLLCGGKSVDVETRYCNTNPCTHVSFGTRIVSTVVVCNPITLQKCTKYKTDTYPQMVETCCAGFSKSNSTNDCIADTT